MRTLELQTINYTSRLCVLYDCLAYSQWRPRLSSVICTLAGYPGFLISMASFGCSSHAFVFSLGPGLFWWVNSNLTQVDPLSHAKYTKERVSYTRRKPDRIQ